ncbi:hypothetical protein IJ768_02770 [Candidatus Saccharibacteria bacterium]|nr:hypothetical protein [Candidatus Saccharibacteria bacterium]
MKYVTKSGREISFYGAGEREDLDKFFGVLLKSWVKRSAYPASQNDPEYNFDNDPSYGQCTVTAMVVQDEFGGTIHRVRVNGGGTHYFNKIDGRYFDLTSDQFSLYNIPLSYEPNEEMDREYVGTNENTKMRYEILKMNVVANLEK